MKVSEQQIESFANAALTAMDVSPEQTESVVRNIIWNELDGRKNFGLQRLETYIARLESGGINRSAAPRIAKLAGASTSIDGDNGFGQYASDIGMGEAIKSAGQFGIGISTVRRSNFFGSGAYFVNLACDAGMIGLAMSNSFPKVAAYGGKKPVLGTNPLAYGAPMEGGGAMIADFATSALAGSAVRDYLNAGAPFPEGAIAAEEGENGLVLAPFGGTKGFAIALLVELLSGVLAGAGVSDGVNSMYRDISKPGENGHALIAIDISKWGGLDVFQGQMEMLRQSVTSSGEARLPGQDRVRLRALRKAEGVEISGDTAQSLADVALKLGIARL